MPDAFRFHFLTLLCVCVRVCVRAWRAYRFARDYAIHSFSRVYCELKTRRYFIEHFDFSAQILASFCIFDANATTDECPTQSRKRRKGYNAGKRLTLVRIHTSVCLCNDIDIGGESTRAFAQRVARARAVLRSRSEIRESRGIVSREAERKERKTYTRVFGILNNSWRAEKRGA